MFEPTRPQPPEPPKPPRPEPPGPAASRGGPEPARTRHRGPSVYEVIQASDDFGLLRTRFRSFVVPAAIAFLTWYFLYVLLAAFAPGLMALRVVGSINVGIVAGLLQFVSTFTITALYGHWARTRLDPIADELRERIEGGEFG